MRSSWCRTASHELEERGLSEPLPIDERAERGENEGASLLPGKEAERTSMELCATMREVVLMHPVRKMGVKMSCSSVNESCGVAGRLDEEELAPVK